MSFNNIAIVGKKNTPSINDYVISLAEFLLQQNKNIFIDCNSLSKSTSNKYYYGELKDFVTNVDLVIAIGGDGTLLGVARDIVDYNIPVVGINQGNLGFMTDIPSNDMIAKIQSIIQGDKYNIESRLLLEGIVIRNGIIAYQSLALNDIVLSKGAIGSMIDFDISINKEFVLSQKSDGVIFATSTGSTAYSLSAGGPILHPQLKALSIVPICPQSLANRPLVVNDDSVIELMLVKDNQTQIHFDGQSYFNLVDNDKIILTKYNKDLKLLHPFGYNYYRTLRKKLGWSKRLS